MAVMLGLDRTCSHRGQMRDVAPQSAGCEACLRLGDTWVHLRVCRTCGHVGCCDNSKHRHATKHFEATRHPIVASLEPGDDWMWCYIDRLFLQAGGG
jgi:uncharacterized UBP type Zn finger protein